MSELTQLPQWQALAKHQHEIADIHMRELFRTDTKRFENFSLSAANLFLDYSKNRITGQTLVLFEQLLNAVDLGSQINAMFSGQPVNSTENRAALHIALRYQGNKAIEVNGNDVMPAVKATLAKMQNLVERIHNQKQITDIVNIGVGGSDLGPLMVTEALTPYLTNKLCFHFVSNIDGSHIDRTLKKLNPNSTLFIISSKSFTTLETTTNFETAKNWFSQNGGKDFNEHFIAVTANANKAQQDGFKPENIFPIWDWVGGRFSVWSAIGLPVALAIGMENFYEFLRGAYEMDQHFLTAPFQQNMPVILAILNVWYINFFGSRVQAILPYDQYLNLLPTYLQQAEMESNGKHVRHDGTFVDYDTGCVLFGVAGTNGQHSFYQLLHQGTELIPVDFIVAVNSHHKLGQHHEYLYANALSQSKALMDGKTSEEVVQELLRAGHSEQQIKQLLPHKILPGNHPSNTIVYDKLTPHNLGALIALYEHKIFTESAIWGINAFDQWSVELGKQLANKILPALTDKKQSINYDASTNGLIAQYLKLSA